MGVVTKRFGSFHQCKFSINLLFKTLL